MRLLVSHTLAVRFPAFWETASSKELPLQVTLTKNMPDALLICNWDLAFVPQVELPAEPLPKESGRGVLIAILPEDGPCDLSLLDRVDVDDCIQEHQLPDWGAAKIRKTAFQMQHLFGMTRQITALVHDCRTPMTIVMATLELLQLKNLDEPREVLIEKVRSLRAQMDRMKVMLANFVDCNRMPEIGYHAMEVDVSAVTRAVLELHRVRSAAEKKTLESEGGVVTACVDKDVLKRMITNMVDHYFLFAASDSREWIRSREEGSQAVLELSYTGGGVLQGNDLEQIYGLRCPKVIDPQSGIKYNKGFGLTYNRETATQLGGSFELQIDPESSLHTLQLRLPRP